MVGVIVSQVYFFFLPADALLGCPVFPRDHSDIWLGVVGVLVHCRKGGNDGGKTVRCFQLLYEAVIRREKKKREKERERERKREKKKGRKKEKKGEKEK